MNDIVIFVVGLGVTGVVLASTIIALVAGVDPEKPRR